jgi:GNAT superfamily N-acetyltransferase
MKTRVIFSAVALFVFASHGGSVFAQTMHSSGSTTTANVSVTPMGAGAIGVYGPAAGTPGYGTIAGSYLSGKGAYVQGLGQYNYNTALATRQLEDAKRQAIDNQLYAEKSYFEMRRLNNENWLAEHPRSTPEQIAQINQSRLPRRLTSSELDPTWGQIRWPVVLQRPEFDQFRGQLDDIFAHRSEQSFGVGSAMYSHVQQFTRDMRAALDKEYDTMTQMEWINAMRFIESLAYETRFAPGMVVGMNAH